MHRLDLNTSGVLLFGKSAGAASRLMRSFETHQTHKRYAALCTATGTLGTPGTIGTPGTPGAIGTPGTIGTVGTVGTRPPGGGDLVTVPGSLLVDAPICRVAGVDHCERRCCAPSEEGGQEARTRLLLVARAGGGGGACAVLATPQHGRTHQVRLHCARAGAPILADPLYNTEPTQPCAAAAAAELPTALLSRHALHAYTLRLPHPSTGEDLEIIAPLPNDMLDAAHELDLQPSGEAADAAVAQLHKALARPK